jgi:tetratricopeptide (TPR) repeat protein
VTGTAVDGRSDARYGSGVILRSNGFIGTAGHVIGAASEWLQGNDGVLKRTIQVRVPDAHGYLEDQWRPAELFKPGPSDVAVIKINGANFKRADCRVLQEVRGTDIYRLGFPEGGQGGWADEKQGKTAVSELPQNFKGSMISQKGMSGGPAIDATGRVVGLSVNRENDPRFASQSFTEFVRIEELAALLPQSSDASDCFAEEKLAKSLGAYLERGRDYVAKGDYDRAIEQYNEALKLDPNYAVAYYSRGVAYYSRGSAHLNNNDYDRANKDYDRAIADYDEAIKLDPKYAAAYSSRGLARWNLRRDAEALAAAKADFNTAQSIDPTDTVSKMWLEGPEPTPKPPKPTPKPR